MKGTSPLLVIILIGVLGLVGLEVYRLAEPNPSPSADGSARADQLRGYAASLKVNQLYAKSAEAYDRYLEASNLSDPEKAKIDFNTGTMLLEQVGDAEGALAHFLRVTELYEEADSEIVKEARKLSAECMEKLGRSGAAERQLIASSQLGVDGQGAADQVAESEVLAKIGERVSITRNDFEDAWKQIPQHIIDQRFPGAEGKSAFLNELVATRLFAEAAKRKGLDRDPQLRDQVDLLEQRLLTERLFQTEIEDKIQIPAGDLDLFFKANSDHYVEPAQVEVAHILTSSATRMEQARAAISEGTSFAEVAAKYSEDPSSKDRGGKLGSLRAQPKPLKEGPDSGPYDIWIPTIGKDPAWAEAVFSATEGEVVGPIQTSKGYSLVLVEKKTEARPLAYEEARGRVAQELREMRREEKRAALVAELMKSLQVKVYEDRLN